METPDSKRLRVGDDHDASASAQKTSKYLDDVYSRAAITFLKKCFDDMDGDRFCAHFTGVHQRRTWTPPGFEKHLTVV